MNPTQQIDPSLAKDIASELPSINENLARFIGIVRKPVDAGEPGSLIPADDLIVGSDFP